MIGHRADGPFGALVPLGDVVPWPLLVLAAGCLVAVILLARRSL